VLSYNKIRPRRRVGVWARCLPVGRCCAWAVRPGHLVCAQAVVLLPRAAALRSNVGRWVVGGADGDQEHRGGAMGGAVDGEALKGLVSYCRHMLTWPHLQSVPAAPQHRLCCPPSGVYTPTLMFGEVQFARRAQRATFRGGGWGHTARPT